jgi:hypothetical protein
VEGGNPVLEWVTYGIVGFVLLTLGVLFVRTAWFFLSLLAIPLTDALGRTRLLGGAVRRWGERGPRGAGTVLDPRTEQAIGEASAAQLQIPASVRVGARAGGALGALPGFWMAVTGARAALLRGDTFWEVAGAVAMALALVAAAGAIAGAAVGIFAGIGIAALRRDGGR